MPHPETLDYGPPPKRNLSVTPREWSGVLFILLAIPAGFLGLAMIIAAFVTSIPSDPQAEPTPGGSSSLSRTQPQPYFAANLAACGRGPG